MAKLHLQHEVMPSFAYHDIALRRTRYNHFMTIARNIKLFYFLNFFTDFVFFAPVAIIYFAKVTGSYALGMSIFSIAYISSAIFEIPTGVVSDIFGRRLTVIFGALASVFCIVLYAI